MWISFKKLFPNKVGFPHLPPDPKLDILLGCLWNLFMTVQALLTPLMLTLGYDMALHWEVASKTWEK